MKIVRTRLALLRPDRDLVELPTQLMPVSSETTSYTGLRGNERKRSMAFKMSYIAAGFIPEQDTCSNEHRVCPMPL